MKLKLILLILMIFPMSLFTYSQTTNSANVIKVLKQLKIESSECYLDLVVEKVMPYSSGKSVMVIPKIIEKTEYFFSCDSYILIIDNASGKILNKFYEANALISDAVRIKKITIDFAPYQLNVQTRAFGVRVQYEGSSRPNPYENEDISLFIPKDDVLIRVLKNISITSLIGEWDMQCDGQFVTKNNVLIIDDNVTNGFHDIILKTKTTTIDKVKVGKDCNDVETYENKNSTLHFNDIEYK